MYPATLSHDSVNCAANLFSPVLNVYFAISVMGDSYAFAVAVKLPPPFRENTLASFRRRTRLRGLLRPVGSSLSSRGRSSPCSLILDYVEKTSILTLNA